MVLTLVDSWVTDVPFNVAARTNAIIKIALSKDRSVLSVPWSAESAFSFDIQGRVGFLHITVVDIDAIFVLEGGVRAFPCCNAAAAAAKSDVGLCHPARPEAVEEIGLPGDLGFVHVCVAQLSDVDLDDLLVSADGRAHVITYCILIAQEASVVEAAIGIGETQC